MYYQTDLLSCNFTGNILESVMDLFSKYHFFDIGGVVCFEFIKIYAA